MINCVLGKWTMQVKLCLFFSCFCMCFFACILKEADQKACMDPVNVEYAESQTSIHGFDLRFGTESGWKWMCVQSVRQKDSKTTRKCQTALSNCHLWHTLHKKEPCFWARLLNTFCNSPMGRLKGWKSPWGTNNNKKINLQLTGTVFPWLAERAGGKSPTRR